MSFLQWIVEKLTNWSDLTKIVLGVIAGAWALTIFRRDNKAKLADILLKLEDKFNGEPLRILLALEYYHDYKTLYEPSLKAIVQNPRCRLDPAESKAIDHVEQVLRFFLQCYHLRQLGMKKHAIDQAYCQYLHLLIGSGPYAGPPPVRLHLTHYVMTYWPLIYLWAEVVAKPWPKRLAIKISQLPIRLEYWWTGKSSLLVRRVKKSRGAAPGTGA